MRRQVVATMLCIAVSVGGWAQSLQDVQQAAKAMGYTGELCPRSESDGTTTYNGEGLTLIYGGAIAGTRAIKITADCELNRGAEPVTSAECAVARVKEFIRKHGAPVGIPTPQGSLLRSAQPDGAPRYQGWRVGLWVEDHGHRSLPVYEARIDESGAIRFLRYVPLANKVASEPTITRDQARDELMRRAGETDPCTYRYCELTVLPDQHGGCALAWRLSLTPTKAGAHVIGGAVDATTGEVLLCGRAGDVPPPIPVYHPPLNASSQVNLPTDAQNRASAGRLPGVQTPPSAQPTASQQAWLAYALAALAALLLIFLIVKLRKR